MSSTQTASTKSPAPSNANGTAEPTNDQQNDQQNGPASLDEGYPEQKHAGAVGLGPEYGKMHAAVSTSSLSDVDFARHAHVIDRPPAINSLD